MSQDAPEAIQAKDDGSSDQDGGNKGKVIGFC